ncbi:MAG: hypothetical protein J6F30_10905 [Cellulosilyticum sp.]|nr:hypothetical protein [Cellulosilyticum sp.]
MPNDDTIKLLRECSAGVEMGIASINDVMEYAKEEKLHSILQEYLDKHQILRNDISQKLDTYHDDEKSPNPIAKAMSWVKTHVNLLMDSSSKEIATLMRDGCDMGIKSIQRYLEQYPTANAEVKKYADRLIVIEREFHDKLDQFV